MCLLLRRRRTGFQKTDSIINHMILYTISTGLVTTVLSCISLGLFAKYGFQFSVVAIGMPLGALYSISMLANLHMRTTLRARLDTPTLLELISNSIKKRMRQNIVGHRSEESSRTERINITTEVVSDEVVIRPMVRIGCYLHFWCCFNDPLSIVATPIRIVIQRGSVYRGSEPRFEGGPEPELNVSVWPRRISSFEAQV
ncbi:hypothetical protein BS47DRAFT_843572 [Hydnum rufescens UP504]|uniref:DUF6534 domain-containing protein n=1 Tax=Hydnum rufescens UP504 TaxID=1448309 RepID=A0A9P6DTZ2_9AGAM|nr:hypothetical protein BS47DRAFT_843572 [Hydnum rufescens UP504]